VQAGCELPNVELSCARRRGSPAARRRMDRGAARPGCLAVARQLERHVRPHLPERRCRAWPRAPGVACDRSEACACCNGLVHTGAGCSPAARVPQRGLACTGRRLLVAGASRPPELSRTDPGSLVRHMQFWPPNHVHSSPGSARRWVGGQADARVGAVWGSRAARWAGPRLATRRGFPVWPNVELTCAPRQDALAARRMMDLGAARPGRLASVRQVERHVRRHCVS